tara:strand:- start:146 stop:433 length:288 start_codon:yes stop_codon:yes gene_type:complete
MKIRSSAQNVRLERDRLFIVTNYLRHYQEDMRLANIANSDHAKSIAMSGMFASQRKLKAAKNDLERAIRIYTCDKMLHLYRTTRKEQVSTAMRES